MRASVTLGACVVMLVAIAACTSSSGDGQTDGGASPDSSLVTRDGATDALADSPDGGLGTEPDASDVDAAGACALIPNVTGAGVAVEQIAAAAPAAAGGAIAAGTYQLTAVEVFTGPGGMSGPTGDTLARKCELTASTYGCLDRDFPAPADAGPLQAAAQGGAYAKSGTAIVFTRACPNAGSYSRQYTATATQLQLFTVLPSETIRETMTKQ
jgi:hypothetical protein